MSGKYEIPYDHDQKESGNFEMTEGQKMKFQWVWELYQERIKKQFIEREGDKDFTTSRDYRALLRDIAIKSMTEVEVFIQTLSEDFAEKAEKQARKR